MNELDHHRYRTRRFEQAVRADLTLRRWLRLHSFLLGSICFAAAWAASSTLMHAGVDRLALRWPTALVAAYAVFIGLLWLWCRWLLSRGEADADPGVDNGSIDVDLPSADAPFRSAGGGDFGGGGATGSWTPEGLGDAAIDGGSEAVKGTLEAAASADEGIVVAVPLAVVIGMALLIAAALGVAVFGLFGTDVLLGVAVEIAFASAGGALAYRARREGWLGHALGRTGWPMLLLLLMVGLLGLVIDHWLPQAHSLPQAVRLLGG